MHDSMPDALRAHLERNFASGTLTRGGAAVGAWFVARLSPTPVPGRWNAIVAVAARRDPDGCVSAVLRHRRGVPDGNAVAAFLRDGGGAFDAVARSDVAPEEDGFGGVVGVMDALAGEVGARRISRYLAEHAARSCARIPHGLVAEALDMAVDAHIARMGAAVAPFLASLDGRALDAVRAADAFDAAGDLWPALDATFGPPRGALGAALREAPGMVEALADAHAADRDGFESLAGRGGAHAVLADWHARRLSDRVAPLYPEAARALASLDAAGRTRVGRALREHGGGGPLHVGLLRLAAALPDHAVPANDGAWSAFADVADVLAVASTRDAEVAHPGAGETWPEWAARLRRAGAGEPAAAVGDLGRMSYALTRQVVWPTVSDARGASIGKAAGLAHAALFSGFDLPGRLSVLRRWLDDPVARRIPDGRNVDDWSPYLREPWGSHGPAGWRAAALGHATAPEDGRTAVDAPRRVGIPACGPA